MAEKQQEDPAAISPPRFCAEPGCAAFGLYPAPTKQGGRIWFCLAHIRAYNARWNAFAGFSPQEIETQIRRATIWERPCWTFGRGPGIMPCRAAPAREVVPASVRRALSVLGLEPPVAFSTVKARYRQGVKESHPDLLGGSQEKLDRFHGLQQAFATIRAYYDRKEKRARSVLKGQEDAEGRRS